MTQNTINQIHSIPKTSNNSINRKQHNQTPDPSLTETKNETHLLLMPAGKRVVNHTGNPQKTIHCFWIQKTFCRMRLTWNGFDPRGSIEAGPSRSPTPTRYYYCRTTCFFFYLFLSLCCFPVRHVGLVPLLYCVCWRVVLVVGELKCKQGGVGVERL